MFEARLSSYRTSALTHYFRLLCEPIVLSPPRQVPLPLELPSQGQAAWAGQEPLGSVLTFVAGMFKNSDNVCRGPLLPSPPSTPITTKSCL